MPFFFTYIVHMSWLPHLIFPAVEEILLQFKRRDEYMLLDLTTSHHAILLNSESGLFEVPSGHLAETAEISCISTHSF